MLGEAEAVKSGPGKIGEKQAEEKQAVEIHNLRSSLGLQKLLRS